MRLADVMLELAVCKGHKGCDFSSASLRHILRLVRLLVQLTRQLRS